MGQDDLILRDLPELKKQYNETKLINRILQVFVLSEGDDVFEKVLNIVLEETGSQHGIFGYISEPGHMICPSLTKMLDECEVASKCIHYPQSKWKGLWGRALTEQRSFFSNHPRPVPEGHPTIHNNLASPVVFQGETIGLLNLANKESDYKEADQELIDSMAERIAPLLYVWIQKKLREDERARNEEELRQREKRLRQKLNTILSSDENVGPLELADLIDTRGLQKLMDDFYKVASIPMSIIDLNGKVLVGVGWQDICTEFHRFHPETCKNCIESDTELSSGIPKGEFRLYRCKNHMWDLATPIIVDDQHLGNILSGQFFFEDETIDREIFRAQAKKYGFNEKEYMKALDRVPRLSRQIVDQGMSFFLTLADMLSQLGYSNIKQARLLNERDHLTDSLRESRAKLQSALNSMTDAVLITDTEGQIVDFNDAFVTLHRFRSKEDCLHTISEYPDILDAILPDGTLVPLEMWAVPRALQGESDTNAEYFLRRKDTGESWAGSYSFGPIRDIDSTIIGAVVVGRDITERKRTEDALIKSEERLRLATEAADMYGWELDLNSRKFQVSENSEQVIGYIVPENMHDVWSLIHPDDLAKVKKTINMAYEAGGEFKIEYRLRNSSNNENKWRFSAGVTISRTDGRPTRIVGVTQDITERKKTEEMLRRWNETLEQQVSERTDLANARAKQLQALAAELVEAEERERKKIAQILHEDLQQLLASARLQLQSAGNILSDASKVESIFLNVEALINKSMDKSRSLSHELSPPVLHQSGLIVGLKWLIQKMEKQFELTVNFETNLINDIESPSLKIFIFRAVQELLFNIVKHCDTKDAVRITIFAENDHIITTVEDRGKGFDPAILESSTHTSGLGLISLKERVQYFGGELKVESEPGKGSRFSLAVPASIIEDEKSAIHSCLWHSPSTGISKN